MAASILASLAGAALVTLTGCRCDEDRPYTPFQVASSLPGAPDPDASERSSASPPAVDPIPEAPVLYAPRQSEGGLPASWDAFGRTLRSPKRTGFAGALELPGESGAKARILAWVFPKPGGRLTDGGLYAMDDEGRAKDRLATLPDFLPTGPDCETTLRLLAKSSAGVLAVVDVTCQGRLLPGTATGALVLTDADGVHAPFILRLSQPGSGEVLTLEAAGSAATTHGAALELTVHIDLLAPSGAHANLPIRFLGKAGGLSRIADAPSSDLETLSLELAQLVLKKKERESALARVDAVRRWVYAVCDEAGTAKVADASGRGFTCGAVKPSLDRLTEAAIEAYLFRDEPWKAIGEYERADFYLGAPAAATRARWAARIAVKTSTVSADVAAEYPLRLGLDVPYPFASPLGYDDQGNLYGLTAAGDVQAFARSEPPRSEAGESEQPEPPAPLDAQAPAAAPSPWALRPKATDGRLLAALVPSCDLSEAQFTFVAEGGNAAPNVALSFLAPRPCRGLGGRPLSAVPLAWQGASLLAIASGQPVLSPGSLAAPPQPIAWGTSLGVEVWSSAGHASWRGPAVHDLHHCVTFTPPGASAVARVACVRGRTAVELRPAAK